MGESDNDLLRLRLGTGQPTVSGSISSSVEGGEGKAVQQHAEEEQITIFYGGRVCVCDVTEIQARAIISMAKLEMDETLKNSQQNQRDQQSPPHATMLQLLNTGHSMQRSLKRFLQKRKTRIDSSSPYMDTHKLPS